MTNWLVVYKTERAAQFEGYTDSFRAVNRYAKLKKQYRVVHFCEVIPPGGKLDAIKREESDVVSRVSEETYVKIRDALVVLDDSRGGRENVAQALLNISYILDPVDESPDEVATRPLMVNEKEVSALRANLCEECGLDCNPVTCDDLDRQVPAALEALGLHVDQAAPDSPSA